jgi:hypothetical protein
VDAARQAARHSACRGRCKFLVVALHNYHDHYGTLPPAYIADANGKPMHSWRVLLLPMLEESALHARYDFSQPWNSPKNIALAGEMPRAYCCPSCEAERSKGETNYVAIVGPQTAWPGTKGIALAEITDKKDDTLLFVETHGSGICWLEPRDLDLATMPLTINPRGKTGISSRHPQGPNAATAWGAVPTFDQTKATAPALKAAATIAGGEPDPPPFVARP